MEIDVLNFHRLYRSAVDYVMTRKRSEEEMAVIDPCEPSRYPRIVRAGCEPAV